MLFLVHCARSKQIHQPLLIQFAFTRSAVQKHSIVNCSLGAIQIFRHGALSLGFEHTLEERQITLEDHSSWSFWSSLTERNDGVQWFKKKKTSWKDSFQLIKARIAHWAIKNILIDLILGIFGNWRKFGEILGHGNWWCWQCGGVRRMAMTKEKFCSHSEV